MTSLCKLCFIEGIPPPPVYYYPEFDATACDRCNRWLEPACGVADCDMCSTRPEKPSVVMGAECVPVRARRKVA